VPSGLPFGKPEQRSFQGFLKQREGYANPDEYKLRDEKPMKARILVTLKQGVLDPQGKAIEGALTSLGVEGVTGVRQGKMFEIDLDTIDRSRAEATLKAACEKLLANMVIENYRIEMV
jgi:phosphoribosylformylglycinamidine synthase subunit PurS